MPVLSSASKQKLAQCHEDLQVLFNTVIQYYDFTIVYSHRPVEEQFQLFKYGRKLVNGVWVIDDKSKVVTYCDGKTKLSNHNYYPSRAIDVAPYPIDWTDDLSFAYFAGKVMELYRVLKKEGVIKSNIRWGGDWNINGKTKDERFVDLPHFEIY